MFYIFLHKVLQVDKHLIYFFFTCKYTECLQFVKLLYYFSICTSVILLLQYEITSCTIKVQYLPSALSNMRIRAVKLIHMQLEESETPYWDDAIDKYFERPRNDTFNNMTYPQYFCDYNLKTKPPAQNTKSLPWTTDQKNRYVIKRKKPVLLRFATYKINDGETFFFQHLILKIPCYSEEELLGEHSTYRERFRTQFPHQYEHAITEINNTLIANKLHISTAYKNIIEEIVLDLKNHDLQRLIFQQLMTLEHQPPLTDPNSTLCLNEDQYKIYDMLSNTWEPENKGKYPYFFMTGPAGTGKSYMTHQIIQLLKSKNINHLLIAPTGVAAQNIGGKTIHSALKIKQCGPNYQTLSISDETTKTSLRKIRAIIIDEVSMVSSDLLSFLSNIFASIHTNMKIFGGIPTLLVRDLAQLPPINGEPIFYSQVWMRFFPLFLGRPQRQKTDPEFYDLLQELRFGHLSEKSKNLIMTKANTPKKSTRTSIDTTYLLGRRQDASEINELICQNLPVDEETIGPFI